MVKFHINANGDAKPCHAKLRCRFGGASGSENHFNSLAAAEEASQKKLEKAYGKVTDAVRKSDLSPAAKTALARLYNDGVRVQHIDSVASGKLSKPSSTVSDVDVVDENPSKDLLASIRRGDFQNSW